VAPAATSETEYAELIARSEVWREAALRVCLREGIEPRGEPEIRTAGWFPVVHVPYDHVVKFYSSWRDGHETLRVEWRALAFLERDRSLPVTRPVARSTDDTEWRYVVLSHVAGRPVRRMRDDLHPGDLSTFAEWLGRFAARLHRVPITPAERDEAWPRNQRSVARRHARAAELVASYRTVPSRLIERIDAWLPPVEELMQGPHELAVTHGELNDKHVLAHGPRGFAPLGVIDFGLGGIGHPLDDLGPVWWYALRCDPILTERFIANADLPGTGTPAFPRHALAWALLHPIARFPIPDVESIRDLDELADRAFGR
jgi:aminoglycoside phosphotransferase (APT) family kinase protein